MADPTETALTAAQVTAKSATTDTNTGLKSETIGGTNYQTDTYDRHAKIERILAVSTGLRVVKVGTGTNCGVWSGEFVHNGAVVAYAGAATQALVDDDDNWVYLTAAGVLTVNQTGFPAVAHVPLATIAVGSESAAAVSATYQAVDIVDYRQRALFHTVGQIEQRAYPIKASDLRNDDFTVLDATGGVGLFALTAGGFGTGTLTIDAEAAGVGATTTSTMWFEFTLPHNYVASADVKFSIKAIETDQAAGTSAVTAEVYESDGEGGVGADLAGSWDVSDITTSWGAKVLTITDAGLVAGDTIRVGVRVTVIDGGGGGDGAAVSVDSPRMLVDVYTDF